MCGVSKFDCRFMFLLFAVNQAHHSSDIVHSYLLNFSQINNPNVGRINVKSTFGAAEPKAMRQIHLQSAIDVQCSLRVE